MAFSIRRIAEYINSLSASSALTSADAVPIRQNGEMKKWLPFNYFLDHTASNVADAAAARTNLGLGTAATHPASDFLQPGNNLSDVGVAATARANLVAMARDAADAILPDARGNLLYTPVAADGFLGIHGAITSGTNIFTATADAPGFTAGDAGKSITIRKAGTNYFLTSTTINAGGAGHAPGDVVPFAGGIYVYVVTVTAGVVTKVYILNAGASATNPATIAQSGTGNSVPPVGSGVGTGLVLNATWVRENLVTTIAGFTNSTTVTLAVNASATVSEVEWGFGTDYSAEIQDALDAGISVHLPRGVVGYSSLTIPNKAVLVGQGTGLADNQEMTTLLWLGAPNGVGLDMDADTTNGGVRISGIELGRFTMDGRGAAAKAIRMRGVQLAHIHPIKTRNHTTVALDLHASLNQATRLNMFDMVRVDESHSELNTHGMWWGIPNHDAASADGQDASRNTFLSVDMTINTAGNGVGLLAGVSDHNTVLYLRVVGNSNSPGVDLLGGNGSVSQQARYNIFHGMDAGDGGLRARATNYTDPSDTVVNFYDRGNGAPVQIVDSGAIISIKDSLHRHQGFRLFDQNFASVTQVTDANHGYPIAAVRDSTVDQPGQVVVGGGAKKVLAWHDQTSWQVLSSPGPRAMLEVDPSTPTGTVSATAVMMGLGGVAAITPTRSGTIVVTISGNASNTNAGAGGRLAGRYGTGTAPANGDARVGTALCTGAAPRFTSEGAGQFLPFSQTGMITGATLGVALWIDLELQRVTAGTASFSDINIVAYEL